jgi:hypothetical protein
MKHKSFSYLYKIVTAICFLVVTNSCTDFLKEQAPSNLTPDNFYSIPDHAEAAIASVYADLRFMGGGAGIFSSNWQLLEALTGTSTTETAQNSDLNNLYGLVHHHPCEKLLERPLQSNSTSQSSNCKGSQHYANARGSKEGYFG